MPTREEIVKARRCDCSDLDKDCAMCPYMNNFCILNCARDAADLIEQQAREIERLKRERNAAIADLYKAKSCNTCAKQYKDDCLLEECMEPCSAFAEGEVPYEWCGTGDKPDDD